MILIGWIEKYQEILNEFNYNKSREMRSAAILNFLLRTTTPLRRLESKIKNKTVFVIGAGPSLTPSLRYLIKFRNTTKIVADGATKALIENSIRPDIVVTDLDGNLESLRIAADSGSIMIVHSHGDNINRLPYASSFKDCIGTTEGKPFGKIRNFGGFTDGDRCVFIANHFGASKIILIGMDFGTRIGKYSKDVKYNKSTKLKKLRRGKLLLEWLSSKKKSDLYTTSTPIKGFKRIKLKDITQLIKN